MPAYTDRLEKLRISLTDNETKCSNLLVTKITTYGIHTVE